MARLHFLLLATLLLGPLAGAVPSQKRDILVLYLYSSGDPQYLSNLQFFTKHAIADDPRSELFVLVPQAISPVSTTGSRCTITHEPECA
jgi:hypothetical protein